MQPISKLLRTLLLVTLSLALTGAAFAAAHSQAPEGWLMAGSAPDDYRTGTDAEIGFLAAADDSPRGFGTLMQTFDPERYRGQRLRLTADIRSEDVASWAGMWLRVDGRRGRPSLAFDNMEDRPIQGTTDWQPYEIVLDVPEEATAIAFGVLLGGSGQVFFDDFRFEVVEDKAPTTGSGLKLPAEPSNLDFSE